MISFQNEKKIIFIRKTMKIPFSMAVLLFISILTFYTSPEILASNIRQLDDEAKLKAQRIKYADHKIIANGDVHIFHKDAVLQADEIEYDENLKTITGKGNVRMTQEGETVFGERLIYHTDTERAILWNAYGATGRIYAGSKKMVGKLYFWAKKMVREKDFMRLEKGIFTTCDIPKPDYHYHFTAKEAIIYPNDEIIAKTVGVHLHNKLLLNRPLVRISLKKEKKQQDLTPRVGYNKMDGYYIRERIFIDSEKGDFGRVGFDVYQKTGVGGSLDYNYRLKPGGWGHVHWYQMAPNYKGLVNAELAQVVNAGKIGKHEFSNYLYYTFPGNMFAGLYYSTYKYSYPEYGDVSWDCNSWFLGKTTTKYNYYFNQVVTNYDTSKYTNRIFNLGYNFSNDFHIRLGGFSSSYESNLYPSRTIFNYYGDVFNEGQYLDTILSYNKTSGLSTYSFDKLPELTLLSKNLLIADIPLLAALSIGTYNEEPTNVKMGRSNFQIATRNLTWPVGNNGRFDMGCGFRQLFYGNKGAKYVLSANSSYYQDFGHLGARLNYFFQKPEGYTPFLTDFAGKYNLAMGGIDLHDRDKWSLGFFTGYDLNTHNYQNLIGRLYVKAGQNTHLNFGTGYDIGRKRWTNINSQIFLDMGSGFSISHWTYYDLMNTNFTYQDFCISKEDHDFLTRVVYRSEQKEVWLQFALKAFPQDPVSIGPDPDRVISPYRYR